MTGPAAEAADAIDPLCYAGESVVDTARVGGATVAVTTHRVLAHTPAADGPTLQEAALPNVEAVELASAGDAAHGWRAVRYGVYAVALFGASFVVNFEGVAGVEPPAQAGAGQVVSMAVAMTNLLGLVDDALRIGAAMVAIGALGFAALYGYSRDRHLRVTVAGGDHVQVPADAAASAAADRLGIAVEKASKPSDG